ncbi:MAG: polysaccharide deacetylase family protein [Bacillota bacterium]
MLIYMKPGTRQKIVLVLALVLVLLGTRVGLSLYGGEKETAAKISPLSRVNTTLPNVGLMVDVSQAGSEEISEALAALETLQVKATWFLDTTTVESATAAAKEIAAKGHELGVKGTDQKALDKLSAAEVRDRLLRSRQALIQAGIEPVPFLYPPLGRYSDTIVTVAFQEGYQAVKHGFDAGSMRGKEETAASKLAGSVKPGDFILVRVARKGLEPAQSYLTALHKSLTDRGLSAVPLSVLVKGVK